MAPTGRLVVLMVLVVVLVLILVPVGVAWDRVIAERNGIRGMRKCIVNE